MQTAKRIVREYGALVDSLKARRVELGLTAMELDARAGWQEGYTSKLENWDKAYGRGIGPLLLPIWLEALGLALVVVSTKEIAPRLVAPAPRQAELVLVGGRMNQPLPPRGFTRFKRPTLAAAA